MFDTGSSLTTRVIGEPSVELAAAIYTEREGIWARETVKDDIAKGNGPAETDVTRAGWNLDS